MGFLVHALRYTYVLVVYTRRIASDCAYTVRVTNLTGVLVNSIDGLRYGWGVGYGDALDRGGRLL